MSGPLLSSLPNAVVLVAFVMLVHSWSFFGSVPFFGLNRLSSLVVQPPNLLTTPSNPELNTPARPFEPASTSSFTPCSCSFLVGNASRLPYGLYEATNWIGPP